MKHKRLFSFANRFLPAIVCGCLLISGGCKGEVGYDTKPQAAPGPAVAVHVITARESPTMSGDEVVGTVEAVHRAVISAKVTGTITEMPVVLGTTVKQGDLLVKLSAAEISARLSKAETAVAEAKRNLDREERLLLKNASTRVTVNSMTDGYKMAEASLDEAKTMLGYCTIRAPISGVVSQKTASVGDMATVGVPLLILENTDVVQAVVAVPEAQLAAIKPGDTLAVRVPAAKVETTGTVAEIAPTGDAVSRTSLVKLDLEGGGALRPGQFVRVVIPGREVTTLTLPETAVSVFGQMERIFVVEKNIVHLRLIRSGTSRVGEIEILSGLNPGEQVVVDQSAPLIDGQPVKVMP